MTFLTFAVLAVSYWSPGTIGLCLWFVALESCLSYSTSGIAKAVSKGWRDGTYLQGIFSTRVYGHPALAAFFRAHPATARTGARALIAWEALFPAVLLLPSPWRAPYLLGGLIFHCAAAVFMGLDTFFWAFLATYPAVLYCAERVSAFLH